MPGKVKVKISSGKNLPVMDRSSDTTDAYVEIKLGSTTFKTDVCRKSLNPQWNTDWYRFEVEDSELQDEPLQIRLMDHDTYSANDAIGKVYLNLNPLLLPGDGQLMPYGFNGDSTTYHEISGWLPVYDTMHGIRGEVNITVKIELFSDFNRFRQSSCGVQFFYSPMVPYGYHAKLIHGFVEELLVYDDPEYQWIDKIRTPRASNEARQTLFFKLSGELQRKIGVKTLDLGGNAVIGYKQSYDLEGESGIVGRGIGTAVTLVKTVNVCGPFSNEEFKEEHVKNYLEFVGDGKSFSLNVIPNILLPYRPSLSLSPKLPDLGLSRYRQLPKRLYSSLDSESVVPTQSNDCLPHAPSLKTLFKQEDERGKQSYRLAQKFRSLKSSQNSLSRKMSALKSKLGDSIGEEPDENVATVGRRRVSKRTTDASVMAELLARSVIHAHNSLSCILEVRSSSQDEEDNENTMDKLEPLANLLSKTVSEPNMSSDNASEERYSSSDTSSSGSDDEDNVSYKDDDGIDTISNIIKDVEIWQRKQNRTKLLKQFSLPALGPNRVDSSSSLSNHSMLENEFTPIADVEENLKEIKREENQLGDIQITRSEPSSVSTNSDMKPDEIADGGVSVSDGVNFQGIIPEAMKDVEIKGKGLIKTAMQALLLDKASILGTYTPPSSPSFRSVKASSEEENIKQQISEFSFPPRRARIPKSASSVSFADYIKHRETVLGAPFTSITSLEFSKKRLSHPGIDKPNLTQTIDSRRRDKLNFFSDNQLNKPLMKSVLNGSIKKSKLTEKLKIFHSKNKTCSSHEFSLNDQKNILRPMPESKKSNEWSNKAKSGLISRIFCHKNTDGKLSTSNDSTSSSPPQCDLTVTNDSPYNLPVDMKIEHGIIDSDTKQACITSNRHIVSSQPEQNGGTCQQNAELQKKESSPAKINNLNHRRSSDSDLSITPKGNSLTGSDKSGGHPSGNFMRNNLLHRSRIHQENFDMLEYPFLTILKFPPDFISQIGGAVSARSVKRLETISNIEEPESRDTWWSEIRMEIRSHARSLGCNAVLGYTETASICEDVCILGASGTAIVLNFHKNEAFEDCGSVFKQNYPIKDGISVSLERNHFDREKFNMNGSNKIPESPEHPIHVPRNVPTNTPCAIIHLPFECNNVPLKATIGKCLMCRKGRVPEVLIATIEPPEGLPTTGRGCFIESYVCRPLKDVKGGEWIAKEISDGLPFLEYELHRLLINKLKIKAMNAIFGLKFSITVGEKMIIAVATGTAVFLPALPSPSVPKVVSDEMADDIKLIMLQKQLNETVKKNKEIYQIDDETQNCRVWSDEESEEETSSLDLSLGNKDCCVLEVDDPEDEEVLLSLMKERPPDGFHVVNTEFISGLEDLEIIKNLQMFTQIRRFKFHPSLNIDEHFRKLLQSVYFKLRRMVPCALCNIQFICGIPEADEVQLLVFGMALGLGRRRRRGKASVVKRTEEEMIFKLDEDNIPENGVLSSSKGSKFKQKSPLKYRPQSLKQRHTPHKERHGVDITPLSYVPGASIDKYLGNFNFFFIRETTSIREEGGLSGFLHSFVTEVLAIVRAHVSALGGNALVAFFLTELFLHHNFHKNQGQCLINVGGDVVSVTYLKEDT